MAEGKVVTYRLKGGEEIRSGLLYGWTGAKCPRCDGNGEIAETDNEDEGDPWTSNCAACAGTGDEWGLMPDQPTDLPRTKP